MTAVTLIAALAAAGLNSPGSLSAQTVDHERLNLIGWKDSCSVALIHEGYPVLGEAPVSEPVFARVGRLTIPAGKTRAETVWLVNLDGYYAYQPDEVSAALSRLKKLGYGERGYREVIRSAPVGPQPGLAELLFSTSGLSASAPSGWPSADYRISEIHYSRLGTCALLVYTHKDYEKNFFATVLTKIGNPRARLLRGRAHISNARLLLEKGDIEAALAETGIAAAMGPGYSLARYHHAALLALTGSLPAALDELGEAVKLDFKHKAEARTDRDFESLWENQRFQDLTSPPEKSGKKKEKLKRRPQLPQGGAQVPDDPPLGADAGLKPRIGGAVAVPGDRGKEVVQQVDVLI